MKVIGLTGGIGTGKTTTGNLLQSRGIPLVDTDLLARQLVEPGQPALEEIREAFGNGFLDDTGRLRRDKMADLVFADPSARRKLEEILHPRIRKLWLTQVEAFRRKGKQLAVVVIPLLFETGSQADLDSTICVACSSATQRQRLIDRGWSPAQIEQRINAQWPLERKMELADFVVWTEGGLDVLAAQLDRIFQ